jgi:hypothetical protein
MLLSITVDTKVAHGNQNLFGISNSKKISSKRSKNYKNQQHWKTYKLKSIYHKALRQADQSLFWLWGKIKVLNIWFSTKTSQSIRSNLGICF